MNVAGFSSLEGKPGVKATRGLLKECKTDGCGWGRERRADAVHEDGWCGMWPVGWGAMQAKLLMGWRRGVGTCVKGVGRLGDWGQGWRRGSASWGETSRGVVGE